MNFIPIGFLKQIIESGIQYTSARSEKRNIMVSNYISIVIALASILLLITRLLLERAGPVANYCLIGTSLVLLVPLFLNNRGFINASRFFLSWVPGLCALIIAAVIIKSGGKVETSDFIGHRFYLLGLACTPFLIFNVNRPTILGIALAGSIAPLLFYDAFLNFFHSGYRNLGLTDSSYDFNLFRVFITFFILSLSFYFLKKIVEYQEVLNEKLVMELENKNKIIQQHANDEVYQLNAQLKLNLQQLSEREFILNESQRIAKIGSWEYHIENAFLFWSDEMYAIFGLDKGFNLKVGNMSEVIGEEGSKTITDAALELFKTNRPFDKIIRAKTPLGYTKWYRLYAFPILDQNDTAIGVRGICHDITFFKEAEQKLKSSEAKFSKVFENYPDFIIVVRESDHLVADVNQRIVDVLGFEKEEVIGRSVIKLGLFLTEEARQEFIDEYDIDGYIAHRCPWKRKDGRIIQVMITGIRIDIEGQHYRMSVVRDITETLQIEREKELAQANLTATINNTEILIWSVDRQFNLITFNIPFFEYLRKNYGVEVKIRGNVFDPLIAPEKELSENWMVNYSRALAGEVVTLEETSFGIDFQYSLSPIIEDNKITGVSVFADNVTDRNANNRDLAEANKKISQLKLMALRSVMSPHFIFNVLNSIQFFIAKNDRLNAINYLSTFSKLIRSVLTHSVSNKIKLADEIELLRNYVQLEMTRFENKFDFVLKASPDIDVVSIELPSLLIQPYVENAILHGLYNKSEKGTLQITILEETDHLIFEIEDDGIGREAAMKIRQKNFPTYKSFGIKVTEERLKLINQHGIAGFEIEDLKKNGEPCGTRVRIKIEITPESLE